MLAEFAVDRQPLEEQLGFEAAVPKPDDVSAQPLRSGEFARAGDAVSRPFDPGQQFLDASGLLVVQQVLTQRLAVQRFDLQLAPENGQIVIPALPDRLRILLDLVLQPAHVAGQPFELSAELLDLGRQLFDPPRIRDGPGLAQLADGGLQSRESLADRGDFRLDAVVLAGPASVQLSAQARCDQLTFQVLLQPPSDRQQLLTAEGGLVERRFRSLRLGQIEGARALAHVADPQAADAALADDQSTFQQRIAIQFQHHTGGAKQIPGRRGRVGDLQPGQFRLGPGQRQLQRLDLNPGAEGARAVRDDGPAD